MILFKYRMPPAWGLKVRPGGGAMLNTTLGQRIRRTAVFLFGIAMSTYATAGVSRASGGPLSGE